MKIDVEFVDDAFNYEQVDGIFEYANIDDENICQPFDEPYHPNAAVRMQNHPLMIMVKNKQYDLLRHPVSIAITRQKWKVFGRYVFYTQLILYLLYLAAITTYCLLTMNQRSFEFASNINDTSHVDILYESGIAEARMVTRVLVVIFASLGILFEFQQFARVSA